jgi:hypothetical protein
MPKVALADTLREWESLLGAVEDRGAEVPHFESHAARLRSALEEARRLEALRDRLAAELQTATADLSVARYEGRLEVISIRGLCKAHFGPRWAGLVQFGIRLRRPRRRSRPPHAPAPSSGAISSVDRQEA